jgi:hypothetical protein
MNALDVWSMPSPSRGRERRKSVEQCTALISIFPDHPSYTRKRKKVWEGREMGRHIEPKKKMIDREDGRRWNSMRIMNNSEKNNRGLSYGNHGRFS